MAVSAVAATVTIGVIALVSTRSPGPVAPESDAAAVAGRGDSESEPGGTTGEDADATPAATVAIAAPAAPAAPARPALKAPDEPQPADEGEREPAQATTEIGAEPAEADEASKEDAQSGDGTAKEAPKADEDRAPPKARREPTVDILMGFARVRHAKISKPKMLAPVKAKLTAVTRCYKRALRGDDDLDGRLVYRFRVRRNGRPRDVKRVDGSISDRRMQACVTRVIKGVRFPKATPAMVKLPLRFQLK